MFLRSSHGAGRLPLFTIGQQHLRSSRISVGKLVILQPGFCWLKIRLAVKESLASTVVFCWTEFPLTKRKAIWYFFIVTYKPHRR